jgi:hypothetical protein
MPATYTSNSGLLVSHSAEAKFSYDLCPSEDGPAEIVSQASIRPAVACASTSLPRSRGAYHPAPQINASTGTGGETPLLQVQSLRHPYRTLLCNDLMLEHALCWWCMYSRLHRSFAHQLHTTSHHPHNRSRLNSLTASASHPMLDLRQPIQPRDHDFRLDLQLSKLL